MKRWPSGLRMGGRGWSGGESGVGARLEWGPIKAGVGAN